jgi:hypothetical protein
MINLQVPVPSRRPPNGSPSGQAATQVNSGVNRDENVSVISVVTIIDLHIISLGERQHRPPPNRLQLVLPQAKSDVTYQHCGPVV